MQAEVAEPEVIHRSMATATVIFDGRCRACSGLSKLVRLLDVRRRARVIPAQNPRALKFVPGKTQEDLEKTFHFVTPEGTVLTYGEALMAVLSLLPGLALVPWFMGRIPQGKVFADRIYAWLSGNRPWISYLA